MFRRFCKVILIELTVLLSLCTCTTPNTAYAISNNMTNTIATGIVSKSNNVARKSAKETRRLYEEKQAEQIQQAEQDQQAESKQQDNEKAVEENETFQWEGEVLNSFNGVANGPSGYETYYNLPMGGVVSIMRGLGYEEERYPYWVRDDGVKMLGDYVMCAANLDIRPYGTILPSSVGMAIVCDTGDFAYSNPYQLDIAVSW